MNCPYCGTKLQQTNWGNNWCPNCEKIIDELKESDVKDPSYIG